MIATVPPAVGVAMVRQGRRFSIRMEPCRQPPHTARFARCGQSQSRAVFGEDAGAGSVSMRRRKGEVRSGDVECIAGAIWILKVRMVLCPRRCRLCTDTNLLGNLQPAKEDVHVGSIGYESIAAVMVLCAPKPPKEEKDIARSDVLVAKVTLRSAGLSEQWSPLVRTGEGTSVQIGIEMGGVRCGDSAVRQCFHKRAKIDIAGSHVAIANIVCTFAGDRERTELARGQDWAGDTAGRGVEAFATENQLHTAARVSLRRLA